MFCKEPQTECAISRSHPRRSNLFVQMLALTLLHRNRKNGRGHGALCAIQHLGVVGEPGGSGRGERVRGAITNLASHRSLRSRHRRAQ